MTHDSLTVMESGGTVDVCVTLCHCILGNIERELVISLEIDSGNASTSDHNKLS